jgi:hypothetical protein
MVAEMSNQEKIDAVADSVKAELNTHRRNMERDGYVMLCATCDNEAARGSCYCEACEAREFSE